MNTLYALALVAQAVAAAAAVLLASRRPEHRPVAIALVLLAVSTIAELPVLAALRPLPRPVEGPARMLVFLDSALYLATLTAVPWLSLVLAGVRSRVATFAVGGVWALASIVLAVLYPSDIVRGASLTRLYLAANLLGLAVAIAAVGYWGRQRLSPGSPQVVLFGLIGCDLAVMLMPYSPWREGLFGSPYDGVQLLLTLVFGIIAILQGAIWRYSTAH